MNWGAWADKRGETLALLPTPFLTAGERAGVINQRT